MIKVLFVCIENSCRSQIAEGFARDLGKGAVEAYSAGSRPSGALNPAAVYVMREVNIDISAQKSKGFADLPANDFDYVVSMGCQDVCPFFPAQKHIEWDIEDPKNKGVEAFRNVRDEIKDRVRILIEEIKHGKTF
jgi:glutathione/glutaredoxin type arsenate reductase